MLARMIGITSLWLPVHVETTGYAVALNESENHDSCGLRPDDRRVHASDATDLGFIGFYHLTAPAHGRKAASAQSFAKPMHKKPRRLVADAERAMYLVSRHAFFGGREKE